MNEKVISLVAKRLRDLVQKKEELVIESSQTKPINFSGVTASENSLVDAKLPPTLMPNSVSISQAISFDVRPAKPEFFGEHESSDVSQTERLLDALEIAGMSYAPAANSLKHMGHEVITGVNEAAIKEEGLMNKVGEKIRTESGIRRWHNRGESLRILPQIGQTSNLNGTEMVVSSQNIIPQETSGSQTVTVLEGINVQKEEVTQIPSPNNILEFPTNNTSQHDTDLLNNPFLGPLKKAA